MDKSGSHCFILCSDAIFYSNFYSDVIHEIKLVEDNRKQSASKFTCLDLVQASHDDLEVFEVVLGR